MTFPLHNGKIPYRSLTENAIIVSQELVHALQNPAQQALLSNIGDIKMAAVAELSKIFTSITQVTPPQATCTQKSA